MLIIGILLFGMLVGAAAQLLLGTRGHGINWTTAIVAGLLGSIVGGQREHIEPGDIPEHAEPQFRYGEQTPHHVRHRPQSLPPDR